MYDLAGWLKDYYKVVKTKPRKHKPFFWASDLWACPRKIFFRILSAPSKDPDIKNYGALDDGDIHEHRLIELMKESGIKVLATQYPVIIDFNEFGLKFPIKGKIDAIIRFPEKSGYSKPIVVEIKTTSSWSFRKKKDSEIPMNYLAQISVYQVYTGYDGIILMKNKDNADLYQFYVDLNLAYKTFMDKIPKLNDIANCILEKKVPPATPVEDWECKFCSFRHLCFKYEDYEKIYDFEDFPYLKGGVEL